MGAPFVNALGDVCETKPLDEDAMKKVSDEQENALVNRCKQQLAYELKIEDSFREYMLKQSGKSRGLKGILDTYTDTMKALAQLKLERDDASGTELVLSCEEDAPTITIGEEKINMQSMLPNSYKGELDAIKDEISNIVGLSAVKDYI